LIIFFSSVFRLRKEPTHPCRQKQVIKGFKKSLGEGAVSVIGFFVGLIEVFSEVAKMVSLSLRLFGNVFAGEVLLTVLASLIAFLVPLPFMALELLVGLIQATVFSMLTLVYLTMATAELPSHAPAH
jgi:F-type H+-transporting ATPase subunit a